MDNKIYKVLNEYYDKRRDELLVLLSEELTQQEIMNNVIWLTQEQHERIHILEGKRFDNYNKSTISMEETDLDNEQMNEYKK